MGQAFEELEDLLGKNNICIAAKEKLVKDSGVAEEIAYDNIVLKLLTKPRARGKSLLYLIIIKLDCGSCSEREPVERKHKYKHFKWLKSSRAAQL